MVVALLSAILFHKVIYFILYIDFNFYQKLSMISILNNLDKNIQQCKPYMCYKIGKLRTYDFFYVIKEKNLVIFLRKNSSMRVGFL